MFLSKKDDKQFLIGAIVVLCIWCAMGFIMYTVAF